MRPTVSTKSKSLDALSQSGFLHTHFFNVLKRQVICPMKSRNP